MPDLDRLISLLEATTTIAYTQDFIRSVNAEIPVSAGSWDDLKARIRNAIQRRTLSQAQLAVFLAQTEECSRQQIFWYSCNRAYMRRLGRNIQQSLRQARLSSVFNRERSVFRAPDNPEIVFVGRTEHEIKIKIVERREWWEPLTDHVEERRGTKIRTKQWEQHTARAVLFLRIEMQTGLSLLHVQKVESTKIEYSTIERAWNILRRIIDPQQFQLFDLSRAFEPLLQSDEVRRKRTRIFDDGGRPITFGTRDSRDDDFAQSGFWKRSAPEEQFTTRNLAVMWKANGNPLQKDLLTFISSVPEQVSGHRTSSGASGDPVNAVYLNRHCKPEEIDHVIGRIRYFNRQA
jgi:hypothetical protein